MSLNGQHSVKIGDSIRKKQKSNLMTFRYDFLPGSVATNKPGEVKVDTGNGVSVKLPNLPGSNPDHTLYKGAYKEAVKECVLIVDRITGQMTLEKIDYNVNLKNCRVPSSVLPNNIASKLKSNEDNKLPENSNDMAVDGASGTDRHDNRKSEAGKVGQTYSDPIFGDFPKATEDRNLSDSDDEEHITSRANNHAHNGLVTTADCRNGDVLNDHDASESDLDSDIDDDDDKQQNDVTAQVAEDLLITDSSLSNSESSSSDSEPIR